MLLMLPLQHLNGQQVGQRHNPQNIYVLINLLPVLPLLPWNSAFDNFWWLQSTNIRFQMVQLSQIGADWFTSFMVAYLSLAVVRASQHSKCIHVESWTSQGTIALPPVGLLPYWAQYRGSGGSAFSSSHLIAQNFNVGWLSLYWTCGRVAGCRPFHQYMPVKLRCPNEHCQSWPS